MFPSIWINWWTIQKFISSPFLLQINGFEIPSEAYLQRQSRHRHVIEIYEVIITDEFYVYVMERPQVCKDLFEVIHERDNLDRPLTENEVRRYFAQILQANISCEENGVLHRDIKPENIIVDMSTDEAKLIDFGLASEVQAEPFTHFRGEIDNEKRTFNTSVKLKALKLRWNLPLL